MQIFLILALILVIIAVVFAVQNVAIVTISFIAWKVDISLAVALLLALGAGVLISVLVSIPGWIKGGWNSASQKKKFNNLATERDGYKLKVEEALADREKYLKKLEASELEISNLEEQLASISGALEEKGNIQGTTADTSGSIPNETNSGKTAADPVEGDLLK